MNLIKYIYGNIMKPLCTINVLIKKRKMERKHFKDEMHLSAFKLEFSILSLPGTADSPLIVRDLTKYRRYNTPALHWRQQIGLCEWLVSA
jgi:hypothetical protein